MAARYERLSFDDVEILRLESPVIAGHTLKLLRLEAGSEPLGLGELREHVAARLDAEPRARQRVAFTPLRLGPPAWVDDAEFDLDRHVRRRDGTEGLDEEGLRRVTGEIMAERLDPERPLWALDLVGPLAGGGTAIVARIHHAMADGIGSLRFLEGLLWGEAAGRAGAAGATPGGSAGATPGASAGATPGARTAAPPDARAGGWSPEPPPSGLDLAAEALRDRAAAIPGAAGGLARGAVSPRSWARAGRSLAALPGAVRRELRPGADDPQLDRAIGSEREVAFAEAPLDELRAIGHSRPGHVTVNDVLLAAIAGGLARWLAHAGDEGALRAQVPVSLHHRDTDPGAIGNRDSFLNVDLPLAEPDPLRRLELINAETSERKRRGDAEELYDLLHALSRVRPAYRAASRLAAGPREFALSISNVPGPREPVEVAGRRVERLCSVAEPAPHHALRATAISNAGTVAIGLCSDPAVLPGLDVLAAMVSESLAELREAAAS